MAKIFSFQRTLTLEPTVDSLRTEVDTLQTSLNSFSKSELRQETLTITSDGQNTFNINENPRGDNVLLSLNGQLLTKGADYSTNNNTITILNNYIETSDILIASYLG
jgi:hypothetical protein